MRALTRAIVLSTASLVNVRFSGNGRLETNASAAIAGRAAATARETTTPSPTVRRRFIRGRLLRTRCGCHGSRLHARRRRPAMPNATTTTAAVPGSGTAIT